MTAQVPRAALLCLFFAAGCVTPIDRPAKDDGQMGGQSGNQGGNAGSGEMGGESGSGAGGSGGRAGGNGGGSGGNGGSGAGGEGAGGNGAGGNGPGAGGNAGSGTGVGGNAGSSGNTGGMAGTGAVAMPDAAADMGCPGACCQASDCPMKANMVPVCDAYQCKYDCAPGTKDCGGGRCIPGGATACCGDADCGECKRCSADKCTNTTNGQNGPGCTGECKACQSGSCTDRTGSCGQGASCSISSGVGSAKQADYCQNGACKTGTRSSCAPYGCSGSACASDCASGYEERGDRCVKCGTSGESCCQTRTKCGSGLICGSDLSDPGAYAGKCQPCGRVGQFCCNITQNEQIGRCTQSWSYCGMGGAPDQQNFGCIPCGGSSGSGFFENLVCRNSTPTPCKPGYHENADSSQCVPD